MTIAGDAASAGRPNAGHSIRHGLSGEAVWPGRHRAATRRSTIGTGRRVAPWASAALVVLVVPEAALASWRIPEEWAPRAWPALGELEAGPVPAWAELLELAVPRAWLALAARAEAGLYSMLMVLLALAALRAWLALAARAEPGLYPALMVLPALAATRAWLALAAQVGAAPRASLQLGALAESEGTRACMTLPGPAAQEVSAKRAMQAAVAVADSSHRRRVRGPSGCPARFAAQAGGVASLLPVAVSLSRRRERRVPHPKPALWASCLAWFDGRPLQSLRPRSS
jgi:hypothetical protein